MRLGRGPLIVTLTTEIEMIGETRFTTSGQMVARIFPKLPDTEVHHVFTLWCDPTDASEQDAYDLACLPVGTKVTIKGHAKTKTLKEPDGSQKSYRAFTITEWKVA